MKKRNFIVIIIMLIFLVNFSLIFADASGRNIDPLIHEREMALGRSPTDIPDLWGFVEYKAHVVSLAENFVDASYNGGANLPTNVASQVGATITDYRKLWDVLINNFKTTKNEISFLPNHIRCSAQGFANTWDEAKQEADAANFLCQTVLWQGSQSSFTRGEYYEGGEPKYYALKGSASRNYKLKQNIPAGIDYSGKVYAKPIAGSGNYDSQGQVDVYGMYLSGNSYNLIKEISQGDSFEGSYPDDALAPTVWPADPVASTPSSKGFMMNEEDMFAIVEWEFENKNICKDLIDRNFLATEGPETVKSKKVADKCKELGFAAAVNAKGQKDSTDMKKCETEDPYKSCSQESTHNVKCIVTQIEAPEAVNNVVTGKTISGQGIHEKDAIVGLYTQPWPPAVTITLTGGALYIAKEELGVKIDADAATCSGDYKAVYTNGRTITTSKRIRQAGELKWGVTMEFTFDRKCAKEGEYEIKAENNAKWRCEINP